MRIFVGAVGRAKAGPQHALYDLYIDRLGWPVTFKEVEAKQNLPPDALKVREAELLLAALPTSAVVVALDESGQSLTSIQFAERLGRWRDDALTPSFLIGGAAGHGAPVLDRADLRLSLGSMTWPHMLVRGMLAEQLYRAQTILGGHPYHRE